MAKNILILTALILAYFAGFAWSQAIPTRTPTAKPTATATPVPTTTPTPAKLSVVVSSHAVPMVVIWNDWITLYQPVLVTITAYSNGQYTGKNQYGQTVSFCSQVDGFIYRGQP